jgi:hypothetical protein
MIEKGQREIKMHREYLNLDLSPKKTLFLIRRRPRHPRRRRRVRRRLRPGFCLRRREERGKEQSSLWVFWPVFPRSCFFSLAGPLLLTSSHPFFCPKISQPNGNSSAPRSRRRARQSRFLQQGLIFHYSKGSGAKERNRKRKIF